MIHRHASGKVAWAATVAYIVALVLPAWERRILGRPARGRAYTAAERRLVGARHYWA